MRAVHRQLRCKLQTGLDMRLVWDEFLHDVFASAQFGVRSARRTAWHRAPSAAWCTARFHLAFGDQGTVWQCRKFRLIAGCGEVHIFTVFDCPFGVHLLGTQVRR